MIEIDGRLSGLLSGRTGNLQIRVLSLETRRSDDQTVLRILTPRIKDVSNMFVFANTSFQAQLGKGFKKDRCIWIDRFVEILIGRMNEVDRGGIW